MSADPLHAAAGSGSRAGSRHHSHIGIEILVGAPLNIETDLDIRQDGEETLDLDGGFRSEPFDMPIYWAVRISRETTDGGVGIELMHDKLFLEDPPDEVGDFVISHGFNLLTLQRAWRTGPLIARAGLGVILAHPENEVRGRRLDETDGIFGTGYHLTGPVGLGALGHRLRLSRRLAIATEVRVSVAPVTLPVAGGEATFTHLAAHLLVGVRGVPF